MISCSNRRSSKLNSLENETYCEVAMFLFAYLFFYFFKISYKKAKKGFIYLIFSWPELLYNRSNLFSLICVVELLRHKYVLFI